MKLHELYVDCGGTIEVVQTKDKVRASLNTLLAVMKMGNIAIERESNPRFLHSGPVC